MANTFLNAKQDLTTTDNTVLYTCPSNSRAIVKSLLVTEDANSGTTIDITLTDASGNVFNIVKTKTIAALATTQILSEPLILMESEILRESLLILHLDLNLGKDQEDIKKVFQNLKKDRIRNTTDKDVHE